jgi:hypothetical protein
MPAPVLHVVVDAANVIGSRPDGWWRDRPGAARRLAGQLVAALTADDDGILARGLDRAPDQPLQLHLVLEGAAKVPDLPTHAHLAVVLASADGDSAIAELTRSLAEAGNEVVVVTADRGLRSDVQAAGVRVVGPGASLRALPG